MLWGITRAFDKYGFPAYRKVRETHAAISAHVAETITGVRVVMAFSAEKRELARLERKQTEYRDATVKSVRFSAGYIPSLLIVLQTLTIVTLIVGGQSVLRGELRAGDIGATVSICGWVARRREHGEHLAFVDVRDHTGVVQCVVDNTVDVRSEYVVRVTGVVRHRPEGTVNPNLPTGEVELGECEVEVLRIDRLWLEEDEEELR